ncbi:MAG: DUF4234 domain-containing protein [Oscillospiraceae bacterium]|nr:DUF4234 domain-containing protein [Oscillospiraceae bacterium]
MLKNRNVALVVVFTIISFGIYGIYWNWVTLKALDEEGQSSQIPSIATFLLCLFVGSVGYALFGYTADANMNAIRAKKGLPAADNKILWLVLGLLVPIVFVILLQLAINEVADN